MHYNDIYKKKSKDLPGCVRNAVTSIDHPILAFLSYLSIRIGNRFTNELFRLTVVLTIRNGEVMNVQLIITSFHTLMRNSPSISVNLSAKNFKYDVTIFR